jgi:hypothetical protein
MTLLACLHRFGDNARPLDRQCLVPGRNGGPDRSPRNDRW